MNRLSFALPLALCFLLLACDSEQSSDRSKSSSNGQGVLPQFTLQELNGVQIDFTQFAGKVLVVDFWATWCKPCINEIPAYNALHDKYAGDNFALVGITMDSGEANAIARFAELHGMKYGVFVGNAEAASAFGGLRGYPSTFVLDKQGQIRKRYLGGGPGKNEEIDRLVQQLLDEAS